MKFSPCIDQCTKDGSHCQGCGRSHKEIQESKALVGAVVGTLIKVWLRRSGKLLNHAQ